MIRNATLIILNKQTSKSRAEEVKKYFPSKPEGALAGRKMHLTSQARLPFRGLSSELQQKTPRSTIICFDSE